MVKKKKIMWENYNLIKSGLQINLVSRKFKIIIIIIYINWKKLLLNWIQERIYIRK